jgi:hypothetical protein
LRGSREPDKEQELLAPMRQVNSTCELQRRSIQLSTQPALTSITARNVMEDAQAWPIEVLLAASTSLYSEGAATPLMDIATTESWFNEET